MATTHETRVVETGTETRYHKDTNAPHGVRSAILITALRLEKNPHHWHITVFNRGGNAGTLCVNAADGEAVAALLLPPHLQEGRPC